VSPILGIFASSTPSLGDFESIQTFTLTGSQTTVTFSSIPSTYKHLQLRCAINQPGDCVARMRFNSDSSASYTLHTLAGNGSSAAAGAATGQTYMELFYNYVPGISPNSSTVGVIDILDYQNTFKNKTARILSGQDFNGGGNIRFQSGLWINTSAITSISFTAFASDFTANSTFALYGIK